MMGEYRNRITYLLKAHIFQANYCARRGFPFVDPKMFSICGMWVHVWRHRASIAYEHQTFKPLPIVSKNLFFFQPVTN